MKKEFIRQVVVFEDHFKEFRKTLSKEALKKLYQILTLVTMVEVIPVKFLKAIEGRKGLYEIRVEQGSDIYRVFCCFDERKSRHPVQWIPEENAKDTFRTVG